MFHHRVSFDLIAFCHTNICSNAITAIQLKRYAYARRHTHAHTHALIYFMLSDICVSISKFQLCVQWHTMCLCYNWITSMSIQSIRFVKHRNVQIAKKEGEKVEHIYVFCFVPSSGEFELTLEQPFNLSVNYLIAAVPPFNSILLWSLQVDSINHLYYRPCDALPFDNSFLLLSVYTLLFL